LAEKLRKLPRVLRLKRRINSLLDERTLSASYTPAAMKAAGLTLKPGRGKSRGRR
jgi:hypothetical protein